MNASNRWKYRVSAFTIGFGWRLALLIPASTDGSMLATNRSRWALLWGGYASPPLAV